VEITILDEAADVGRVSVQSATAVAVWGQIYETDKRLRL